MYIAPGVSGLGKFVTDDIDEGLFIRGYSGERITTATAISRRLDHSVYRENPDYMINVNGYTVLIDATDCTYGSRFGKHGCFPIATFVTIALRDSSYDIFMVESVCIIPAGPEVLVSYGWVYDSGDTIVIFNCGDSNCRGMI